MAIAKYPFDDPLSWETLEDWIEHALDAEPQQPGPPDWYQDSIEYSLPKECMPHWRTVH